MSSYLKLKAKEMIYSLFEMRVSLQIILLLFVLLLSVLAGGYLAISQLKIFRHDAFVINNLGIIRGSIQRITKNELSNKDTDNLIQKVDTTIETVKNLYVIGAESSLYVKKEKLNEKVQQLKDEWIKLKQLYYKNRVKSGHITQILKQSEICWDKANIAVFAAQKISEQKLEYYRKQAIIILSIIGIFILAIVVLVYKIVLKNLEVNVITDPVTSIYNRSYFNEVMHRQEIFSKRYNSSFSLIMIDIDFFKKVNDEFGHPKGDDVLIQLSQVLTRNTREVDDVFRLGGEEFAVIVPQSNLKQATVMAEKYREQISETDFGLGRPLTVSIGVSQFGQNEAAENLVKRTDKALYQAKSSGRARVVSAKQV